MLTLPIKKLWFDMIRSGEKKQEYREIKPYYNSRLGKYLGNTVEVKFRNGYSKMSPYVICECKVETGTGRAEWGAVPDEVYFVLNILEIKNSMS